MSYVPEAGDIVWIDFNPQIGREQAGYRPALVLSPSAYNRVIGLMIVCPTTTRVKGYPYEVALAGEPPSVALADHARSMDWRTRRLRYKTRASTAEMEEVRARLAAVIGLS